MMNQRSVSVLPRHQSGVVLVISLIMLLALTIIGITSSSVTGLQEKMSANSKELNLAFQSAEAALRAAEDSVKIQPAFNYTSTVRTDQGVGGLYTLVNKSTTVDELGATKLWVDTYPDFYSDFYKDPSKWTDTNKVAVYSNVISNGKKLAGLAKDPVYIVEKIRSKLVGSNDSGSVEASTEQTASGQEEVWMRITAHGWGSNINSVATVQSVVKVIY